MQIVRHVVVGPGTQLIRHHKLADYAAAPDTWPQVRAPGNKLARAITHLEGSGYTQRRHARLVNRRSMNDSIGCVKELRRTALPRRGASS